eukprot:Phypoly_transcript_18721.p1 GENE.Phypoly_transcript_18721~~Phypoly_transcript_18721.p1  ORF type:complete len:154 (+),score=26.62 Phypoly_transcript_18721:253-714(+)
MASDTTLSTTPHLSLPEHFKVTISSEVSQRMDAINAEFKILKTVLNETKIAPIKESVKKLRTVVENLGKSLAGQSMFDIPALLKTALTYMQEISAVAKEVATTVTNPDAYKAVQKFTTFVVKESSLAAFNITTEIPKDLKHQFNLPPLENVDK